MPYNNTVIYISLFIISFIICIFLFKFFINKSKQYILKKSNESGIRWGSQSKPISGGITFYIIFVLSSLLIIFIDKNTINNKYFEGIFIVITLSFLMGLADDIINTSPYFKLFIQILSGFILIHFGIIINVSPNIVINNVLTILWIVGIMNSINMIDNMDAISSLVGISIIVGLIINILLSQFNYNNQFLYILIPILASLCCFLIFNWSPSKIYMGDNGSQLLGSLLASFGILFIWNVKSTSAYYNNSNQILTVTLAFLVPIIDTTTVTINRILNKKSPFVGGKDHTTHYLSYLGFTDRKIALILFSISMLSVLFSVYVSNYVSNLNLIHLFSFGSYAFIMFILLYINTKITKPK